MKFDATEITKLARDTGFPADNLEKVLWLRALLQEGKFPLANKSLETWPAPALKKLGQSKAGLHSLRRFRLTWLRKNRVSADLERFWMGHENESVGDDYSKLKDDVAFRLEQAEKVGLGFEIPKTTDVVRIVRKNEVAVETKSAA